MTGLILRCVCVLALLTAPALAEGRKMLGAHQQRDWQAVGRLNTGAGFCTGALVAPDLVVTAAHCLYARRTGKRLRAERVHFVAGYRLRKYAGHSKAASLTVHPRYRYSRRVDAGGVAADLALVKLAAPLEGVAPLSLEPSVMAGDEVAILSYGRDRPEIPSIQSPCKVEDRVGPVMVLDCDVTYGVSGAPVFRMVEGEWRIVGVVSAMGEMKGESRAFAVVLQDSLGDVLSVENQAQAPLESPENGSHIALAGRR